MRLLTIVTASLLLTACVTQDQADVKMAKGCAAGINALLEEQGKEVSNIKTKNFSQDQAEGGLHRRVTFEAIEKDGLADELTRLCNESGTKDGENVSDSYELGGENYIMFAKAAMGKSKSARAFIITFIRDV